MPLGLKRVGRPVSHSTAGNEAKTLPTTNRPLVCSRSLAFSQPMIFPVPCANAVFKASETPRSFLLTHQEICF